MMTFKSAIQRIGALIVLVLAPLIFGIHPFLPDACAASPKKEVVDPEKGISADIFGKRGGNYHPFVLLKEVYTDNLFATNANTKDDYITTLTPGIWIAFPGSRDKIISTDTRTESPGGLQLSRIVSENSRRYQAYVLYSAEFKNYSSHSDKDHSNHKAQALFQYNFSSGLSFDVVDIFNEKEEVAGNGVTDTLYTYQDNLVDLISIYKAPSGKLKLELNYSNYQLDYKDTAADFRDRKDNSGSFSMFYKFWPKTSLLLEYQYTDINFDTGNTNDSTENRFYSGLTWNITQKTKGLFKLGYTDKDFDTSGIQDQDDFSFELQTRHTFSPKQVLQINGYRKFHESDLAGASSYLSTGLDINILQRFSAKWSAAISAAFEKNNYNGFVRDDELYSLEPTIRFQPKKWLRFDLGYHYSKNDSNVNLYDYELHEVCFGTILTM